MEDHLTKKCTLIFIRHGEKEYNNLKGPEGSPLCDPELKSASNNHILEKSKDLRKKYGDPLAIFTSPYIRTRQTSKILSLGETEVVTVTSMSEYLGYLGYSELKNDYVDSSTLSFGDIPSIYEEYIEFKKRIKAFTKGLSKISPYIIINSNKINLNPGTYWFVTHGLVMYNIQCSYITFKHNVTLTKKIPYLGGFTVKDADLIYDL